MRQNMNTVSSALVGAIALLSMPFVIVVFAEETTDAELTSPQLMAAWKLQAEHTATELQLADDHRAKLTEVYAAARQDERKTQKKLATTETDRNKLRRASDELAQSQRKLLMAKLKEFLTDEQANTAIQSLGTFSDRWDRYVNVLATFGLDE